MFKKKRLPTYEILVSGRVQGIGYRWFVREQAQVFNVKGSVRNLFTGQVKVIVQGNLEELEPFIDMLKLGNGHSTTEKVEVNEIQTEKIYGGFTIEH
ncbi:MAG: acylphosphatase [Candidatus Zophobacter franzmannii]|jgi:acylphosphatase|nr:acylphosphatase [Candidatus Zophobacter franzmannii]